jgi:hypothetical protein
MKDFGTTQNQINVASLAQAALCDESQEHEEMGPENEEEARTGNSSVLE